MTLQATTCWTSLRTVAYTSDNDKLFLSKLDDGVYLCNKRQQPYFFPFLTEREQAIAKTYLDSICFKQYMFFGGYDAAERKLLGLFFDEDKPFPIAALDFAFRKSDTLTHRDFLGALMSLGIERETVGDILVEDGRCVVFVNSEISDYIISQIYKVGNVGVKVSVSNTDNLPKGRGFEEKEYTVPSLRLDAVISAVTGLSREKSKRIIQMGNVTLNHFDSQNPSKQAEVKDVLTIRGKGKYVINGVLGETKKHRIRISIIHYR